MNILFWIANHSLEGQRSLEDPMTIFAHQARALGHDCVWNPKNDQFLTDGAGINILVEGFTEDSIRVIAAAHDKGARFLCIATEEPTPTGFNHGRDKEMVLRQKNVPLISKYLEGIFHLVPGEAVGNWYRQFAPTAYVELGYAPNLMRMDNSEPEFDFGFFGSLTPRRLKILKRLARYIGTTKAVRIEGTFASQQERDRIMRQARVIVQVRKHEEMGLVSSSRCNTALCLGRPVIAEPHLLSKPWDEVIRFSTSLDDFYKEALMMRTAWRGAWARQFEVFKTKLTPQFCVGRAFQEIGFDTSAWKPQRKVA